MASVLITGASPGIGRAVAAEFAGRGYRVVATARGPSAAGGGRAQMMTPQEAAAGVADAAGSPRLRLRMPLGVTALGHSAARREAPDTVPAVPGQPAQAADAAA